MCEEAHVPPEEVRRFNAVDLAIKMFPQGAGHVKNVIDAAKEIEKYLSGETPPQQTTT